MQSQQRENNIAKTPRGRHVPDRLEIPQQIDKVILRIRKFINHFRQWLKLVQVISQKIERN